MAKKAIVFGVMAGLAGAIAGCQASTSAVAPSPQTVGGITRLSPGVWGGKGIRLTIGGGSATIQYDCDSGTIDEPLLSDRSGAFAVSGTHSFGRGGPRSATDVPVKPHAARYEGRRNGEKMQLKVLLPDLNRQLGPFELSAGETGVLELCL